MRVEPVMKLSLEDDRLTGMKHRGPGQFQVHACEDQDVYLFLSKSDTGHYSEVLNLHRNAAELLIQQLQDALQLLD